MTHEADTTRTSTEVIRAYVNILPAEQIAEMLEVNGHKPWHDPTDVTMMRGYLHAMISQDSITLRTDADWRNGKTFSQYDSEIADAATRRDEAKTKGTQRKYANIVDTLTTERRKYIPVIAVAAREARETFIDQSVERRLYGYLENAKKASEKFAKRITDENMYAARMALENVGSLAYDLRLAKLAEHSIGVRDSRAEAGEEMTLREAASIVAREERRAVERDGFRSRSSNVYSNALTGDDRAATVEFIDTVLKGW